MFFRGYPEAPPDLWKQILSVENLGNPGKNADLGSGRGGGGGGVIFIVNVMKRIAVKLRRMILLQFGLVTFRFHDGGTLNHLILMISGFSDVSLSPGK